MSKAYESAVRLLAMREHGAHELMVKLTQKGFSADDITAAIETCQALDLQSDKRYVESLRNTRIRQGYGPLRIRNDLYAVKIDRDLIDELLQEEQENWASYANAVRQKKYKTKGDITYAELQKQKQFLLYRGFSMDIIAMVFNQDYD